MGRFFLPARLSGTEPVVSQEAALLSSGRVAAVLGPKRPLGLKGFADPEKGARVLGVAPASLRFWKPATLCTNMGAFEMGHARRLHVAPPEPRASTPPSRPFGPEIRARRGSLGPEKPSC